MFETCLINTKVHDCSNRTCFFYSLVFEREWMTLYVNFKCGIFLKVNLMMHKEILCSSKWKRKERHFHFKICCWLFRQSFHYVSYAHKHRIILVGSPLKVKVRKYCSVTYTCLLWIWGRIEKERENAMNLTPYWLDRASLDTYNNCVCVCILSFLQSFSLHGQLFDYTYMWVSGWVLYMFHSYFILLHGKLEKEMRQLLWNNRSSSI
jgi:hypothetical protein